MLKTEIRQSIEILVFTVMNKNITNTLTICVMNGPKPVIANKIIKIVI